MQLSQNTLNALPWIIGGGTIALCAFILALHLLLSWRKKKHCLAMRKAEYKEWMNDVKQFGGLTPTDAPIRLNANEDAYYNQPGAALYELASIRMGSIGGASFTVTDGVTMHSGGTRSESRDEWRETARGTVCITTQRILFIGNMRTHEIPIANILSVKAYPNETVINYRGHTKPIGFFDINGYIFATVMNMISEQIQPK